MKTPRLGSAGDDVASLQRALNLKPDGVFGPLTEAGVRDFQRRAGLAVDGVAGPQTLAKLIGTSRALSAGDITEAADKLGIDEASMRTVLAVESAGAGYVLTGAHLMGGEIMRRRLDGFPTKRLEWDDRKAALAVLQSMRGRDDLADAARACFSALLASMDEIHARETP